MNRRTTLLLLAIVAALPAVTGLVIYSYTRSETQDAVARMKSAVVKDFHDPDSAKFRGLQLRTYDPPLTGRASAYLAAGSQASSPKSLSAVIFPEPGSMELCGEVNAKNAFGAYVGYRAFWVSGATKPTAFLQSREGDTFPKDMCAISATVLHSEP